MYIKEDILKNLNADNYFIDKHALDNFIKNWNIDAIYENEEGTEFFDALSISKIKKGISLKSQGYSNEQIVYKLSKISSSELPPAFVEATKPTPTLPLEAMKTPVVQQTQVVQPQQNTTSTDLKNVTIDVTNQTLQLLAEAVAQKITTDIKDEIALQLIETGSYKRDNQILSKQVQELLNDNKKMALRIQALETKKKSFWHRIFG